MIASKTRTAGVALALLGLLLLSVPLLSRPAAAAIDTPVHHAYVVKVIDTSGTYTYPDTDQQLLDRVDQVLDRWVTESDHLISSFTRVGGLATYSIDCTGDNVHDDVWDASDTIFPGVDFDDPDGNHMIVIGPNGCEGGHGIKGYPQDGLSNGGLVYVDDDPSKGTQSLIHELGHNFGLNHAHALECTDATTCSVVDYGNEYAIMGYTLTHTPPFTPASLDSFERTYLKIAGTCEVPSIGLVGGQHDLTATYDLFGRGTDAGTRGLQFVDPQTGKKYFVDWRNHTGRDAGAGYGGSKYDDGVTVEEQRDDGDGYLSSILQPIDPGAGEHFGLKPGETFSKGGITVQVVAADPATDPGAAAQVIVTLTDVGGANSPLPKQQGTATISGSAALGSTLTATPSDWTEGACYRYQWYDNGVPIEGALSSTYTVPASAAGHQITVSMTGQETGFASLAESSAPVVAGEDVPTAAPTTAPVDVPTTAPVDVPTTAPVDVPTTAPVDVPTTAPVDVPTSVPTDLPTTVTFVPGVAPSSSTDPSMPPAATDSVGLGTDLAVPPLVPTPSTGDLGLAGTGFDVGSFLRSGFAVLLLGAIVLLSAGFRQRGPAARRS